MKVRSILLLLVLAFVTPTGWAHDEEAEKEPPPAPPTDHPPTPTPELPDRTPGTGGKFGDSATSPDALRMDSWTAWWSLNRHRFLDFAGRRAKHYMGERSGASPHFFGEAGRGNVTKEEARKAREPLVRALLKAAEDPDVHVSTSAIVALGKASEKEALPVLLKLAGRETADKSVRESALLAIGLVATGGREERAFLEAVLRDGKRNTSERAYAVLGLGYLGDVGAVPGLMALARARQSRRDIPALALLSLGLMGDEIVVPDLARLLANGPEGRERDDALRACVAAALAKLGSRAAIPSLHRALADKDKDVRRQAVLSLGALAGPSDAETVKVLLQMFVSERDSVTRGYLALALGEIGDPKAADALLHLYRKGDAIEVPYAAIGLGLLARKLDDATARETILALLRTEIEKRKRPDLRAALATALGLGRDESAAPQLRKVLGEKGPNSMRSRAAVALGMVNARLSLPDLRRALEEKGDHFFRREVALAIGLIGDRQAGDILTKLIREGSSEYVRGSAALALGYVVSVNGAIPLVEILSQDGAADTTRSLAAVALGVVLEEREVPVLTRLGTHLNPHLPVDVLQEALRIY
jgi:HEAT repeat protein